METYTEPKRPANSPIPLRLVRYSGKFADLRAIIAIIIDSIGEVERTFVEEGHYDVPGIDPTDTYSSRSSRPSRRAGSGH